MYKVFLVEDEPLIRQNIRTSIDKVSSKFIMCGEAGDGELALSIMQEVNPDILITDIKMPFIDGLELSRHAKAIMPWLKIIIISGYDEFDLARQAISIGVEKYLLKPITRQDLATALDNVAAQIEDEKRKYASNSSAVTDDQVVREALMENFLEQIVMGNVSTSRILEQAKKLDISLLDKCYLVLICQFDCNRGVFPSKSIIKSKLKSMLESNKDILCFSGGTDRLVLILKASEVTALTEKAYLTAQILKHELETLQLKPTTCISNAVDRISQISSCFSEVSVLLKKFGSINQGQIFSAMDVDKFYTSPSPAVSEVFSVSFENKLKYATQEDIGEIIEEFNRTANSDQMQSVLYRYYILMDMVNTSTRVINHVDSPAEGNITSSRFGSLYDIFQSSFSKEDFADLATKILKETIALRDNAKNCNRHVKMIRQACEYISLNYSNPDISLISAAAHVAISPTHFSTVFSQEMGVTFIEYLTCTRMEKAKDMLVSSSEKLSSIAFQIGYNEPNYFSYLFKKREGMSPKEYRQNAQHAVSEAG